MSFSALTLSAGKRVRPSHVYVFRYQEPVVVSFEYNVIHPNYNALLLERRISSMHGNNRSATRSHIPRPRFRGNDVCMRGFIEQGGYVDIQGVLRHYSAVE